MSQARKATKKPVMIEFILVEPQQVNDKETCPRCMHPWDAHAEDVGCTIGHTNHWCQCESSLRKYLEGVEATSENRALALESWEADCNRLRRALQEIEKLANEQYLVSIGNQWAWSKVARIAAQATRTPQADKEEK